jgi:hypothetical protein
MARNVTKEQAAEITVGVGGRLLQLYKKFWKMWKQKIVQTRASSSCQLSRRMPFLLQRQCLIRMPSRSRMLSGPR